MDTENEMTGVTPAMVDHTNMQGDVSDQKKHFAVPAQHVHLRFKLDVRSVYSASATHLTPFARRMHGATRTATRTNIVP